MRIPTKHINQRQTTLSSDKKRKSDSVLYVTLRGVHLTVVAVKTQYELNIMNMCLQSCQGFGTKNACSLLYSRLWPLWLYYIFPHYLINGKIFGKKLLNIKCVLWFSSKLCLKRFSVY